MRKTLKLVVAFILLISILMQPISVLAIEVAQEIQKDNIDSEGKAVEVNVGPLQEDKNVEKQEELKKNEDNIDGNEAKITEDKAKKTEANKQLLEESNQKNDTTAPEENKEEIQTQTLNVEGAEPQEEVDEQPAQELETKLGDFELEITLRLPTQDNFNVKIKKDNVEFVGQKTEQDNKLYYYFENLEKGTYELTVTGENYITYTQNIEISSEITKISLSNGHDINDRLKDNQTKYGVIGLGDITGDGIIDEKDEDKMIEIIESKTNDSRYDLNKDGKVDIIDLSYVTFNKGKNTPSTSTQMLKLTPNNIEKVEGTDILSTSGDISSIFKDDGETVKLVPKNGEEISEENPVQITLNVENDDAKTEAIVIQAPTEKENIIKEGEIVVTYNNAAGEEEFVIIPVSSTVDVAKQIEQIETIKIASLNGIPNLSKARKIMEATVQSDGTIIIDLGGQIAIKKITIKITKTGSNKLADIAKVEFLNDMESKIPEPEMDIPENVVAVPGSEKFTVNWKKMTNITGYEVAVTLEGKTQKLTTAANNITVSQFGGKKIKNGTTFKVKVQSVNGDWRSGYSEEIEVTPEANKAPDAPENVKVQPGYKYLNISWKKMDDTDTYNLYYKKDGETEYKSVTKITTNSYMLTELEDGVRYQIYLTGTNKIGTSKPSKTYEGTTIAAEPPITSNYKLLNTPNGVNEITSHIKNVTYPKSTPADKFDIVDNDYTSSWKISGTWDSGGYNDLQNSPIVEFDDFYEMDRIILVPDQAQQYDYFYHTIYYWNESGQKVKLWNRATMQAKTSSNGKKYYEYEFTTPIKTNKIQINLALYSANNSRSISISEMKFYHYDTIQKDINELFTDQMHLTLREDVTEETLKSLEDRLNTPDSYSGELHYKKDLLQREIDTARLILNDEKIKPAIQIDTAISKKYDGHLSFSGGLNAAQPLGVVGYANETIAVYVGSPNKAIGASTNLRLVATQYHAESGSWQKNVVTLKVGKNEITIPNIQDLATEHGGSLYVEYTGNNTKDVYAVRVSGGHDIPMLNIAKVTDVNERKELVKAYVTELENYVPTIESEHNAKHKDSVPSVNYDFDQKNCILGATEIVIDKMMYSVSAKQILSALGNGTTEQKAEKLYNSLVAMEDMLDLFYQHKGLNDAGGAKNKLPSSRLNIRYQRMFAGAFMYAGGLHIGIEWGSIPGLASATPVVSDENGKYESGRYFGWGIAHEIGHIINEGNYAIAEVTNNYFSVLAQAKDTNDSVRFKYRNVYDKVTSGTKGRASNVFTQLGMYWQLHLAYDKGGYNYKTFDNYEEQLKNLFFARVDTYSRDQSKAPKPNGVALTLNGTDTDNRLMRLSVAAAEKNILEFFEDWGMIPDEGTIKYAEQFEKETRRIKFVNDEARAYELAGNKGFTEDTTVTASIKNKQTDCIVNDTQIRIGLNIETSNPNALLGYEIYRNGKSVGFVTAGGNEFVDTINVNNRVYTYEVAAVDKLLNATEKVALEPIKVRHDGSIGKDGFTITTNMTSTEDYKEEEDECINAPSVQAVSKLINKNTSDVYTGIATANGEIIVELNEVISIIGIKVTKANVSDVLPEYEIQIMNDKHEWESVKSGTFDFAEKTATIYFDKFEENKDARVQVYDTAYVKLILKNGTKSEMEISLSELDILGKPGDNVEILKENGIGTLKEDYILDETKGEKIPAGSFIVTGEYSGHPAYNAIKLYDENGDIIEGMQVIFATDPKDGQLGNITEGTWIYYIEPDDLANLETLPTKVRAELYRVDDALTLEGERLVSDSLVRSVPETLPEIKINKGN